MAVKKSGREYVRYSVSNESVQTEMKNVEQVHAGNQAAFEAVKVESVVRNGLVADVNLWEEQKRVNEDVKARAKAEARRYWAKLDNVMFLIGEMEARQEGMEKDSLESIRRSRLNRWWRWRERSLARSRG